MEKGSMTILIPNNMSSEDIKKFRQQFKKDKCSNEYKLNIIVSGSEDATTNLGAFLVAKLR